MAIGAGDILFTSNFTDTDPGGDGAEQFSFIAATDISAGEVIRFHGPDTGFTGSSDAYFDFTVGAGGLSALDRVTIVESADNTMSLVDASQGTLSGMTFTNTSNFSTWSIVGRDNIIASSGGEAIAAINNGDDWDLNFAATGLSRTAIDTAIANDDPSPVIDNITSSSTTDNSAMFTGSNITDIDNPAFWATTATDPDYTTGNIGSTTFATQDTNIFCFTAGTLIDTPQGEQAVESLCIGGEVLTAEGEHVAIKWIGVQDLKPRSDNLERSLVRITAGALGENAPHSDLVVTGDHGMIIEGMVVSASALVNATSIDWVSAEGTGDACVYHVETQEHDVILANGVETETFVDVASRASFDNYQEYLDLYGVERIIPEMNRVRISSQRLLPDAIKARLQIMDEVMCFVETGSA
jgi:hypothetical protein